MRINSSNLNNTNFNGTLKIHNIGANHTQISKESIKLIEKAFAYATKDESGHMDVLLYDRYSRQIASPDKIFYTELNYSDYADTYIKNCKDNNVLIQKIVSIFYGFKNVKNFKDNILTTFR